MALTTRGAKGRPLTHDEMDANFEGLANGSLVEELDSSKVEFRQSGNGQNAAAQTVQEKLRQTKAVLDFVTDDSVRAGIVAGTDVSDHTTYLQAALNSDYNLDFQGYTFYGHTLTDDKDSRSFVSSNGVGRIIKNANGALFTSSGDDVVCQNLQFLGDSASPTFTGDGAVFTGERPTLNNCGSQWHPGRALKATGGHVQVIGTFGAYATTDATASGYDIEIGVSGTATLYHMLLNVLTGHANGGILLTDTGAHSIIGGQIGKLNIASGTSPAGVNGGKTIGCRIIGDITVNQSSAVFSANQLATVSVTFGASTSGCRFDVSNSCPTATITNSGNTNNLIIREVSSGSVTQLKFGDDTSTAILDITHGSGVFEMPALRIQNTKSLTLERATGAEGATVSMSAADNLTVTNAVTDKAIVHVTTGTGSGSRHQFNVNGTNRLFIGSAIGVQSQSARTQDAQGATVTAANNLALGTDGNYFQVDGATQINLLQNTSWQGGAKVTLKFNSTPTVKHNQATSGSNVKIMLAGAVDFVASANDTLTLRYDATDVAWYEVARAVI